MKLPFALSRTPVTWWLKLRALDIPLKAMNRTGQRELCYDVSLAIRRRVLAARQRFFMAAALGAHSDEINAYLWTRLYNF